MTRHILICGEVGIGKSTLIEKLLRENKRPLSGFITKRMPVDENGVHDVYIHPANAKKRQCSHDNLIGVCNEVGCRPNPNVFDTVGLELLKAPPQALILMDELGFMESEASSFCARVLETLDGDIPVLAAVKDKETPFLHAVRTHYKAMIYHITKDNRDTLPALLIPYIKAWNALALYGSDSRDAQAEFKRSIV